MLIKAVNSGIPIHEVAIETVYEDNNRGTHFNPLVDSLRIYFVFLRFVLLSIVTAALDFVVFSVAFAGSSNILASTICARLVAGLFNFHFARTAVFKSHGSPTRELASYVFLVVALMIVSYGLLTSFVIFLGFNVYLGKAAAETALFLGSFAIQRLFVFGRRR
jgi:putative flippase GtrA